MDISPDRDTHGRETNSRRAAEQPLAAIDMGSNSFRLELGQLQQGRYKRIDYFKETVRLGAGLDAHGLLSEEAAQRGLTCLRSFATRLVGFAPMQVRAVATQTLREAKNRDQFLLRAQEALGHPIEVISGREEARLIYAGVAKLQPSEEPRLVIDIGGRSTEIILGQGRQPQVAESFAVGCVSLTMRFFPDGEVSKEGFRAAQVAAGAELEEALQAFAPGRWQRALGSSGTAGAASQVLHAAGITDGRITPEGLRWCMEKLLQAGHVQRIDLPGLKADRRAVLPGGLAILYTLCAHFNINTLWPAKGALRQGVIVDLHDRLLAARQQRSGHHRGLALAQDTRELSVAELQRRFQSDRAQAQRVAEVALALFDGAGLSDHPAPSLDGEKISPSSAAIDTRRELAWACALHEVGLVVSHHDHHRHSAYLIAHVDAAGFSQNQQRRLADLVLAQRGGLRKVENQLSSELYAWQLLCLRLAVIKCHARAEISTRALKLTAAARDAVLSFSPAWAESHPRTHYLLTEEAAAWAKNGPLRLVLQAR